MSDRVAIVQALESLEVGDQAAAVAILLSALEDGPPVDGGRRRSCSVCGAGPMWPGELDDHRRRLHEPIPPSPRRRSVRLFPPSRDRAAERTESGR